MSGIQLSDAKILVYNLSFRCQRILVPYFQIMNKPHITILGIISITIDELENNKINKRGIVKIVRLIIEYAEKY